MICCIVFATLTFMPPPGANAAQDAQRLELGRPMERMIGGLDTHRYKIALNPGLYLRIAIAQQGIDVIATVLDPAGRRIARIDRPNGPYGPETVSVIAEAAGDYLIEVRTALKLVPPGGYVITATEMREAKAEDRRRVTAEYTVSEAEELRFRETADSLSQAVEKFSQAITIWRSLGERYEEAIAVYGRGWSYRLLGDYYNAICDLRQAASRMESLQDRNGEAVARSWLAWTYIDVGENEQAHERFQQALQSYQSLGNLRGQAIALYGIGITHALTSEPEQALQYFERSLELRRKVGDKSGEVLTLSAIGMTYNYLGRPEKAIDYSQRALELSRAFGGLSIRINPLSKLGWAHLTLRHLDESLDCFEESLRICQSIGDRASEIPVRYGLARVEMERGRLDEARRHIEASVEIIESLRGRNSSLELRSTYLALAQDHYQLYTELLMRLHRNDPTAGHASAALQVSERERARSLLDALAEAQIDLRSGMDAQSIAEERRLQRKLNDLSAAQMRLLSRKYTAEQASALDANIKTTIGLLEETRANIKKANPSYAALTQPQPVSVERIQRELLDDDTLLLEYALGEERSYLFLVSSSSLQAFTLPPRAEIEARARRVYDLISARALSAHGETPQQKQSRIAAADAELPREAAELSRMILSPAATQLGEKRLLIVAQGALQLIPFAALPAPESGGARERESDGARERRTRSSSSFLSPSHSPNPSLSRSLTPSLSSSPLLVNHEIVNLPSASTLAVLRGETAGRRPAPKTIALLADPIFEKSDERLKLADPQTQRATQSNQTGNQTGDQTGQIAGRQRPQHLLRAIEAFGESKDEFTFPRLTSTGWEAEQIARLAPADQVFKALSFDANRQLATSGKLSDYRIVHFASHSFINAAHPDLSGIVLSLVDRNGQEQDGFLRLHEIYNLKLPADLVVLGGCRTGLGKEIKGEGLMSLTRGFMYAGAPRVIVSAWEVQDRPSATLMVKFYRGLLGPKRLSAAAALRAAQIEMLRDKQFAAPYFWAGFTLQGEWR
ncbi:MAG TPA: CHAT domain-containing protein [Blastocatellia bacterium]|nr:CHAT domain-containing protein [Blastocatellia bacterium]